MNSPRTKILIIDDEQDLCYLLSSMLAASGFDATFKNSLTEGMNFLIDYDPDWVILDNNLPDGSGWERTANLLESHPRLSIIHISANPDSEHSHKSDRLYYLNKPIGAEKIIGIIREHSANET